MVTTEVLVGVSDVEIEELTAKSSEQLRQYVIGKDHLRTLHWNDKLQGKHLVDDFGRETSPASSSEKYERLDLDIYWDSLHWLLTGSPDADSVAPHVKLYHYARKTTHKNLYEITQMENRVTYRFGPLSTHGTRTVTKIFTDKELAEADVLANLEDKFEKGYRTAFISDPEERLPKSHSKKRSFSSLVPGGSKSGRQGKKKKVEEKDKIPEEAELKGKGKERKQEEGKEGEQEERSQQESESEQPREPPPSQVSQETTEEISDKIPEETPDETPEASSSGLSAAEIVSRHSQKLVEAEEKAMERLDSDPMAAYPVSAPDFPQAKSSVTDLVPIPSVKVYEKLKGRNRAHVEPSDLTPAQLNEELGKYGLSVDGGLKKKLARLSLHMMKLFPVEKHPHELGFLAGGGKVLSEHLFKGELRAVSAKEAREFSMALEKLGDEVLRERFNVDQANQLVFRSVKGWEERDVEKLLHYAHSLGVFLKGMVKEDKGFLVYLK